MPDIKSGIFIMPFHPPDKELAQCHDEDMELLIESDKLGIDEFWVGEHHTLSWEPIVSPEMFIAAGFRQTEQIRIGPAPLLLNFHHPAQVANRLSFLDHFSHGRLNLAFGHGGAPSDFELYNLQSSEMQKMSEESMGMILELWKKEPPYEITGKYWNIVLKSSDEDIGYGKIQKPLQTPYPPISVPVTGYNSNSAKIAAKYGFSPFSHSITSLPVLKDNWETYSRSSRLVNTEPDRSNWKLARTIFIADSDEEAIKKARNNSIAKAYKYLASAIKKGPGLAIMKSDPNEPDSEITEDYLINELVIAGSVETVISRLQEISEYLGPFGTLINMSFDWIDESDKRDWLNSMALFQNEVIPTLSSRINQSIAPENSND